MTKKHFIALADHIRQHPTQFDDRRLDILADFCESQNPRFKRERWIGYINGTNGPCGGRITRRAR